MPQGPSVQGLGDPTGGGDLEQSEDEDLGAPGGPHSHKTGWLGRQRLIALSGAGKFSLY